MKYRETDNICIKKCDIIKYILHDWMIKMIKWLRSNFCDYSNAYIFVKGKIGVRGNIANDRENKKLPFKNNAPFRSCISKINNAFIDNSEDVDVAMPMYNLGEYSDNYSMTPEILWNYYRDEVNDNAA